MKQMPSVKERLRMLSDYVDSLRPEMTTFLVADGSEFHTPMMAEEYLYRFGATAPDGRRIVLYPHPVDGVDALSLSLYQMLDQAVEIGKLEFPELESDET